MDVFSIQTLLRTSLLSGVISISLFLCDRLRNKSERKLYYLAFFFWFLITIYVINILVPAKLHGIDVHTFEHNVLEKHFESLGSLPNAKQEIQLIKTYMNIDYLSQEDRKYYGDKVQFHKENAERTYADAKSKCWWLPDIDDRDKAKKCFVIAAAGLAPGDPKSKLITLLVATLIEYGLDCIDEWNYINNKLYWSNYHYEMMEFYQEVLDKA